MKRIAIVGGSATGKSAAAARLASEHGFQVRHCGEAVRRLAHDRGVPFSALAPDDHRMVDHETREFVAQSVPLVVEGRYLHLVLATSTVTDTIKLVKLTATSETRRERLERRSGMPASLEDIGRSDQADAAEISRLYAGTVPLATVCLDTTALDEQQVVDAILRMLP